ncbi:MAG: hypothetical protein V4507_02950 [Verrucomicrobiota bacterium]
MKKSIFLWVVFCLLFFGSLLADVVLNENFDGDDYVTGEVLVRGKSIKSAYGAVYCVMEGAAVCKPVEDKALSAPRSMSLTIDVAPENKSQISFSFGPGRGDAQPVTEAMEVSLAFYLSSLENSVNVVVRDFSHHNAAYVLLGGAKKTIQVSFDGKWQDIFTEEQGLKVNQWYYLRIQLSNIAANEKTYFVTVLGEDHKTVLGSGLQTGNFSNMEAVGEYSYLSIYDANSGGTKPVVDYFDNVTAKTGL